MARLPNVHHVLIILALTVSLPRPAYCNPLPMLVPVYKDPATSLHIIPFYNRVNLVVDIAGPLVWSTCQSGQAPGKFGCKSDICSLANAYPGPGCSTAGCGQDPRMDWRCMAHPYNPVTGACAAGSLVHASLFGSTTDGRNPVGQVSIDAVSACGTNLLASLPRSAAGVAGLAGSGLALPAQVASSQKLANKFLLCLSTSDSNSNGVAIFGGGPFHLPAVPATDYTQELQYTPLLDVNGSPAYHITAHYIALDDSPVPLPPRTLDMAGVVLRTTVPYTELRGDVYRPFVDAFGKAMAAQEPYARTVKPVPPFGLCYDARTLGLTRNGYAVPSVTLALDGGKNWTMTGVNSMVYVGSGAACLAFVEMKAGNTPAVIVGGFQMENSVLQFDLEKKQLGFLKLPFYTQCSHFNFTSIV